MLPDFDDGKVKRKEGSMAGFLLLENITGFPRQGSQRRDSTPPPPAGPGPPQPRRNGSGVIPMQYPAASQSLFV